MGASSPLTLSAFLVAIAVEYSPSSLTLDTSLFGCLPQQNEKYRQRWCNYNYRPDIHVRSKTRCRALRAHRFLEQMFSFERRPIRSVRVNVLGSSQTRKNLAKAIAQVQLASNKIGGEPIRFAQDMGWVRPDFNPEMYLAWLTGMVNAQLLIELDGNHPDRADWVVIAKRSVCLLLGIPEPKYVKPKSKTK